MNGKKINSPLSLWNIESYVQSISNLLHSLVELNVMKWTNFLTTFLLPIFHFCKLRFTNSSRLTSRPDQYYIYIYIKWKPDIINCCAYEGMIPPFREPYKGSYSPKNLGSLRCNGPVRSFLILFTVRRFNAKVFCLK